MIPRGVVLLIFIASCSSAVTPTAKPTPPAHPVEVRAIEKVLEQFRAAISAKDGAAIDLLLLAPDVPFRSRRIGDVADMSFSTGTKFARDIEGASRSLEERFSDVVITADEELAILDAKYSFHVDGKMTNHGREIWVLVKTQSGWKLASVTWSK